jgi:hypothetical protein
MEHLYEQTRKSSETRATLLYGLQVKDTRKISWSFQQPSLDFPTMTDRATSCRLLSNKPSVFVLGVYARICTMPPVILGGRPQACTTSWLTAHFRHPQHGFGRGRRAIVR